ncbi:ABC transporter substrate-binding protein [Evansella sp. AB-rgal1]|uniref:ABC transporter substrate-binding protein n=1 Tax=Evansella sp. AB-rgal1 TaxID=3242696 RepID=UPI00359E6CFB
MMRVIENRIFILVLFIFFIIIVSGCRDDFEEYTPVTVEMESGSEEGENKSFKILHVMSYHTPWEWTETQYQGFQDALEGIDIEYKVFEMDTKNFSTEEQKKQKGEEAIALIESWQPDLLFTGDDDAQEYVARHYTNTNLPIVFTAVNEDPAVYGYDNASNVTGVLEREHFLENLRLMKEIVPDVEKIAVIFDEDPMWGPVRKRMDSAIENIEDISFVSWDYINSFETYKERIIELQSEVDAIALLGIFTFEDSNGQNVHYRDVLEWTAENSKLPDFSFWKDRVTYGTLSVVSVSGYEQGKEAGLLARQILEDGKRPDSLPIRTSMKGEPLISLARAEDLGIQIKSKTLLSSRVVTSYGWVTIDE